MRKLEPFAHAALLLAALLACKGGSKSSSGAAASGGDTPAAVAPAAEEQPTATAMAPALVAEYKANEVSADAKWKGKYIYVGGIVGDIKKDVLDDIYVTLGSGAEFELENVHCQLAGGQEGAAANLKKGQKALFKGHVSGMVMMSVIVKDCELVPSQPAAATSPPAQPAQAPAKPAGHPTRKR